MVVSVSGGPVRLGSRVGATKAPTKEGAEEGVWTSTIALCALQIMAVTVTTMMATEQPKGQAASWPLDLEHVLRGSDGPWAMAHRHECQDLGPAKHCPTCFETLIPKSHVASVVLTIGIMF
jgi:hypothetical protein